MKNILSRICALACVLFGIGGGIWMFILLNKYFDINTNAFKAPSSSITVISIYIGVSCVLSVAAGVFASKKEAMPSKNPRVIALVPAVIFAVSGVMSAVSLFGEKFKSMWASYKIFTISAVVLTFAVAAYFVFRALGKKGADALSLSLPIWTVLMISSSYFNTDHTFISYPRTVLALALSAITLFSLECVRRHLGKSSAWLKGLSSSLSLFLGLTYFISRLLIVLSKSVTPAVSDCLELSLLGMILFIIETNIFVLPKDE